MVLNKTGEMLNELSTPEKQVEHLTFNRNKAFWFAIFLSTNTIVVLSCALNLAFLSNSDLKSSTVAGLFAASVPSGIFTVIEWLNYSKFKIMVNEAKNLLAKNKIK